MEVIMPLLKENFMTMSLSHDLRVKIAGAMKIVEYKVGDKIITYGDAGRDYYILSEGKVGVKVYQPKTEPTDQDLDSKIMFTKELNQGAGFGELALIYNDKRSATLTATEPCVCYVLDGILCKQMIIQSSMQKRSTHAAFLNGIKLFDNLESKQKLKLVDGLLSITLKKDAFVFREGDEGMEFFIIEQGEVDCLKDTENEQY
jgi:cAMP-dependent protein kinase regulator